MKFKEIFRPFHFNSSSIHHKFLVEIGYQSKGKLQLMKDFLLISKIKKIKKCSLMKL